MSHEFTLDDLNRADTMDRASATFVMDEDAFRSFYDRNARSVWAFLSRVTGDPQAADDLLQESFYRFLRAGATHEDESHRRNSLFRIAANLARDAHRRGVRRPLPAATGEEAERVPGPGSADAADSVTGVRQAMARLKPREREMLWLAYAEGASHEEIAETLGLRKGSIKLLLFRARRNMAAVLNGAKKVRP